jgi:hypothetical protein
MLRSRLRCSFLVALLSGSLTSCSYLLVNPPVSGHSSVQGNCKKDSAAPRADALLAVGLIVPGVSGGLTSAIMSLANSAGGGPRNSTIEAVGYASLAALVLGIPFALSAGYGRDRIQRCLDAQNTAQKVHAATMADPFALRLPK